MRKYSRKINYVKSSAGNIDILPHQAGLGGRGEGEQEDADVDRHVLPCRLAPLVVPSNTRLSLQRVS